jgi:hypothetical protein
MLRGEEEEEEEQQAKVIPTRGRFLLDRSSPKAHRVLVFSAFVILLAMFVYTVYLLLTHFTHLFTSDVFWEHVKDIVKVSSSADCSEELPMQRGRQ